MTPTDEKKLRGILDAIRFDGKSTDHAYAQIMEMFKRDELKLKNQRDETKWFYLTFACIAFAICFIVQSCYQSA